MQKPLVNAKKVNGDGQTDQLINQLIQQVDKAGYTAIQSRMGGQEQ